jgi:hypothetical protein
VQTHYLATPNLKVCFITIKKTLSTERRGGRHGAVGIRLATGWTVQQLDLGEARFSVLSTPAERSTQTLVYWVLGLSHV